MVYILLGQGFEEAEALATTDVLRRGGVPVSLTGVAGSAPVTSAHDITVTVDAAAADVRLQPGDMVVLPGGMGGVASIESSAPAMALIREAAARDDLWLAAICAAPTLLARAGLLPKGTPAVCYPGMEDELSAAGAVPHMDRSTITSGKFIFGRAPGSAFDFGLALLTALRSENAAETVRAGLHYSVR